MTPRLDALLAALLPVIAAAGREALRFYAAPKTTLKADGSPVTAADQASERVILAALAELTPDLPVISEEQSGPGPDVNGTDIAGGRFWLVDPLDGTREFIDRNGEFTVNIALIDNASPVLGLVHAPTTGQTYTGAGPGTASLHGAAGATPIRVRVPPEAGLTVLASRSHGDPAALERFLACRLAGRRVAERRSAGSSLKLCLVAAGQADLYPRLGPTMEWDVAAGQAVMVAAGGRVETLDGAALGYGKPGLCNPPFAAYGDWR